MKRNRVPAPRRAVTSKELVTPKYGIGSTYYIIRLECGHVFHRTPANAKMNTIYCKRCLEKT